MEQAKLVDMFYNMMVTFVPLKDWLKAFPPPKNVNPCVFFDIPGLQFNQDENWVDFPIKIKQSVAAHRKWIIENYPEYLTALDCAIMEFKFLWTL